MFEFIMRFYVILKFCECLLFDIILVEMISYIFLNCFGEIGLDKYILILVNEFFLFFFLDGCG